jgi:hypothetical protein
VRPLPVTVSFDAPSGVAAWLSGLTH